MSTCSDARRGGNTYEGVSTAGFSNMSGGQWLSSRLMCFSLNGDFLIHSGTSSWSCCTTSSSSSPCRSTLLISCKARPTTRKNRSKWWYVRSGSGNSSERSSSAKPSLLWNVAGRCFASLCQWPHDGKVSSSASRMLVPYVTNKRVNVAVLWCE